MSAGRWSSWTWRSPIRCNWVQMDSTCSSTPRAVAEDWGFWERWRSLSHAVSQNFFDIFCRDLIRKGVRLLGFLWLWLAILSSWGSPCHISTSKRKVRLQPMRQLKHRPGPIIAPKPEFLQDFAVLSGHSEMAYHLCFRRNDVILAT